MGRAALLALALVTAGPPGVLAEADAARQLLDTSPLVRAARGVIALAEAEVVAAGVLANPTLALDREQVFTAGGATEQHRLGLQVPLPLAGLPDARRAIAAARVDVSRARAHEEERRLLAAFHGAFAAAVAAADRARVRAEQEAAYAALRRVIALRRRAGESAGADLDRAALAHAAVAAERDEARAAAHAARGRLAALLGRPVDAPLAPTPFARPAAIPGLLARALATRPDLVALAAEARAAALEADLAGRRRWPEPAAALGLKQTNEPTVQGYGYTAGVTWPFPAFDRAQGDMARARAAADLAAARLAAARAALAAELPAAHAAFVGHLDARDRYRHAVLPRLASVARAARVRYQEGEGGLDALLAGHEVIYEARLRAIALDDNARAAGRGLAALVGEGPEVTP